MSYFKLGGIGDIAELYNLPSSSFPLICLLYIPSIDDARRRKYQRVFICLSPSVLKVILISHLQILPPELQSQIASHCSPRELAALARVHPSYRAEFEKALYEIVILRVSEALYDSNKVSSVALKAEFVKRLLIIIVPSNSSRFMDTLFKTCDLLSQTSNVIDLRVRIPSKPDANIIDTVTDILDKALRYQYIFITFN